jgi:hypothetical protein
MLELDINKVDNREVDTKRFPIDTLYFPSTNPLSESIRTLSYKNTCPIPISFHWSIYKSKAEKIFLEDEASHYRVEPFIGNILANEEKEFKVYFTPLHAEPYYEYADFIIENIPIRAMKNPPAALK